MKKILSIILVSAVLFGMVLSANAYTYIPSKDATAETKTASINGDTYVYDFTDSHIPLSDLVGHNGNASETKYDNGRLEFKVGVAHTSTASLQAHEMYIADSFCVGPQNVPNRPAAFKLSAEAGHIYEITVSFSHWATSAGHSLCLVTGGGWNQAFNANTIRFSDVETTGTTSVPIQSTSRYTTTFTVDADRAYTYSGGTAKFNYIGLGAVTTGTYNIYTITVKVFDKAVLEAEEAKKEALYNYTNSDTALNFNGGYNDLYMPNTCRTGLNYELATDPAGVNGNVMKVTNTMTGAATMNFGIAAASGRGAFADKGITAPKSAEGFKATAGKKYIVSYDIYVESIAEGKDFAGDLAIYLCDATGLGKDGGNKTQQSITKLDGTTVGMLKTTGKWQTVTVRFTASKSAYMAISWISLGANNAVFYLDNINVRSVETDNHATSIKRSIRTEGGEGETYVSAGLRFRGEMYGETANGAADLGFVVVPESLANGYTGSGKWFELTDGVANLASAKVVSTKDKLYGTNGTNNQYQLIITNLTKEGVADNLKGVNFKVVMYRLSKDGTYTYYTVGTASYNEVNAAYLLAK